MGAYLVILRSIFKVMDKFLKQEDELALLIEAQARILYHKISTLPVDTLPFPDLARDYYEGRHNDRKFFSVQTAAELLYRSIKLKNKPVSELVIMDYGAGMGSLFLLASMIGCKTVVYNDIIPEMTEGARVMAEYLAIPISLFITGDHKETIRVLRDKHIECDIILSRNVVEHIYDLDDFYGDMAKGQPEALIYFSTTANFHNPAMLVFHKRLHRKAELTFLPQRKALIRKRLPGITEAQQEQLAAATRGLAMHDLDKAIDQYATHNTLPDPGLHYSNTCDPSNGLWSEHIIPVSDYQKIIGPKGYKVSVIPAFWDTHNKSGLKNTVGKVMNTVGKLLGDKAGLKTTAFIYIIAEKK
ncbi:hypothetical protein B0I18_10145 [Taibaiella chishuiensis]|uniref:Methyltransferase family protein n=2 Tax=Taibaiella chishuiensis TaxID=1434707 RepID=A0A2P8D9N0_9BACT|nr:hypothetical protein B0I18_10145 [Taibaiella chishuiensis]